MLIGLLMLIYWVRVLRMAIKARKREGHGGNFIPREKLGRWLRLIWNPLVVAWIALPLLAGLRHNLPWIFSPMIHLPVMQWIAFAIALLAFWQTIVCWRIMGRNWRMGINPSERTQLVLVGPWGFVRHPIYALSSLLMLCTLVIVPSPVMAICAIGHLFLLQWEARREEQFLLHLHGDDYARYAASTGRFIPRSRNPYVPGSS